MSKMKTVDLNELFGLPPEDEEIEKGKEGQNNIEVNISDLVPFKNHPFKLYEGERLNDMVESIKEFGIITPLIVRPIDNFKYEILSGHNRVNAGEKAGLTKAPVVIKENLTDEEAMLIVTETNLIQRSFSELSHSEKARILTERHNAIKDQGRRTDLINEIEMMSNIDGYEENSSSYQIDKKLESNEKLGEIYDMSSASISRYLRIDKLIQELKKKLDKDEIPFVAGIDLSYLDTEKQNTLNDLLDEYNYKIDLKKASEIKRLNKVRSLTYNKMNEVLSGEYLDKPKKKKPPKLTTKFTKNIVKKYVTEERSVKEVEEIIETLLEDYFAENNK